MEKYSILKKSLVISVVFLFLSTAFASNINASYIKPTKNDELVEIVVDAYGQNELEKTVQLSIQKSNALEIQIDLIKKKLDSAQSREETIEIFKEAITTLDTFGLLPEGMSIKQAQELVLGSDIHSGFAGIIDQLSKRDVAALSDNENVFCLVAGKTNQTVFEGFRSKILITSHSLFLGCAGIFANFYFNLFPSRFPTVLFWLFMIYYYTFMFRMISNMVFTNYNPLLFASTISIGENPGFFHSYIYANGWVHSVGLNGIKSWEGLMVGTLRKINSFPAYFDYAPAISGFTGIKFVMDDEIFYLGSALKVGLQYAEDDIK